MKKIICFTLVLFALLGCLTACNFIQNMSGAIAGEAEATPKVEEMMAALADDNASDAKALLHPQVAETSDNAIAQMSAYLAGRKASASALIVGKIYCIYVNNSIIIQRNSVAYSLLSGCTSCSSGGIDGDACQFNGTCFSTC